MSLTVFVAVLGAALLHATWNAMIKNGADKQRAMLVLTVWQGGIGLAVVLSRPWPGSDVWPWLLASGVVHTVYQLFLAYAYEQGDLSRVYPISRGTAPMIVLVVGALFLPDTIAPLELVGVLVLGCGILAMARGVFTAGESRKLVPYALGAAAATASYTLIDGAGARIEGDAVAYVGWLLVLSALFFIPAMVLLRGRDALRADRRLWASGLFTGAASYAAYVIAVWAMTQAPIALVAALRETSILFAVLIGWLVFGERMNAQKGLAAALIVVGVVLTRI